MSTTLNRIKSFQFPSFTVPIFLLFLSIISFGLLIPWIGFYWDDWAFAWISQKLGSAGLTNYFSTNRPVWGLLYQMTTPLLGETPWRWQVFALFWRWTSAVALWWLVRLIWPEHKEAAVWVSALFAVYPGFSQQHIAITYGHFYVVYTLFLLSQALTVLAIRRKQRYWIWSALALALSLFNLLAMEYFFVLEMTRFALIWAALSGQEPGWRGRLRQTVKHGWPYLVTFITAALWRVFFFQYQTQNYETRLLDDLKAQPFGALLNLAGAVIRDIWTASFGAWGLAFRLPDAAELGGRTTQLYWGLVFLSVCVITIYLLKQTDAGAPQGKSSKWAWPAAFTGLFSLLAAGWPFWLTRLTVGLDYPTDRFTFPFMLGTSLLLAGLVNLAPLRRQWPRLVLLGIALSFAVGTHFENANAFRRTWNTQKLLFWQLAWRVPALEPGTTVLSNDLPVPFCSDNSLTSPLNWIYAPESASLEMPYVLYYPTVRLELGLKDLKPGLPIQQNYLATTFTGNTSQVIAIHYEPPACLRVLDSEIEPLNKMIPELMRASASLSSAEWIHPSAGESAAQPPAGIFGAEPAHQWCYYFEKADLARQLGDWETVAALGNEAFNLGDYPNDPTERMPFIEGYAHTGDWNRAQELTRESADITPLMQPLLCRLWERINANTQAGDEKTSAVETMRAELGCQ